MSLRLQLLAFGLLTLGLPWAGMRVVEEMEGALRSGLEASLLGSAGTVAGVLENQLVLGSAAPDFTRKDSRSGRTIYAHALKSSPQVDGRRDDWGPGEVPGIELDAAHRVFTGTHDRFAYVFIEVEDDALVYQSSPGRAPHGDRVVLLLENAAEAPRWLLLLTGAPGTFRAQYTEAGQFAPLGRFEERVVGAWQETRGGFNVEARVPLSLVNAALGIAIIDVDGGPPSYSVATFATWDTTEADAGAFVYHRDAVQRVLDQFARSGDRFRVLDGDGWVLADTGSLMPVSGHGAPPSASLAERFFRYALRREDATYANLEAPPGRLADAALRSVFAGQRAVAWYRDGPETSAIVAATVPIRGPSGVLGAVLVEQASDPILTLTDQALLRLVTFTVAASVLAALGLLAYASFLSFRVRRLARAAEMALGPEGEINVSLPGHAARDELGDLTRSFAALLGRLREYTQYLRTLTGKLTHELRTPLAIVSTSLDNLEHEVREPAAAPYLQRLRDGTARLDSILVAMSAATRIEQAINDARAQDFDLATVVRSCATAYADVYPQRSMACHAPATACTVRGSSELVAQLLDKLVENAASFSPAGATIALDLDALPAAFVLSVANPGPPLPAAMRHQLFDSLVSVRAHGDGRTHLGLGLYIVALIAKFHAARIEADNLEDGSGVVFRVYFPRAR
jgi:dedicated sortase system histidine kinase